MVIIDFFEIIGFDFIGLGEVVLIVLPEIEGAVRGG